MTKSLRFRNRKCAELAILSTSKVRDYELGIYFADFLAWGPLGEDGLAVDVHDTHLHTGVPC